MTNNLAATTDTNAFVPIQEERMVLVNHWVNNAIDGKYFIFYGQCFGSSDLREIYFAENRVKELARVFGSEEIDQAIAEAYKEAAQRYERNDWIVFCYGNAQERSSYQASGGQLFSEFKCGEAEEIASRVVERIFRDETPELQQAFIKEELVRYEKTLSGYNSSPEHIAEVYGIFFPSGLHSLIKSAGMVDYIFPNSGPDTNSYFGTPSIEQGKALLAMLGEIAKKGEGALRDLVTDPEDSGEGE